MKQFFKTVFIVLLSYSFTKGKTLAQDILCKDIHHIHILEKQLHNTWSCEIVESDRINGIRSELTYIITGLPENLLSEDMSGSAELLIRNGEQYKKGRFLIALPPGTPQDMFKVTPYPESRNKRSSSTPDTKSVLVIRVKGSNGEEPSKSVTQISRHVFGGRSDTLNLKSGYESCSFNKMKIEKATGSEIVDGVIEVTLSISTDDQADEPLVGGANPTLENEVKKEAKALLGEEITSLFDLIMICLPPGTNVATAYARGGGKISVYNDDYCYSPSTQMHEIGHNLRLRHSNEGLVEYGDQSCLMGQSYRSETNSPKMCFNGAKSWLLGWYEDKSFSLDFSRRRNKSWDGVLIGVTDYANATNNDNVVVEVVLGDKDSENISNNLYLLYNIKRGINNQVKEFGNKVTVTQTKIKDANVGLREQGDSQHLAALGRGDKYRYNNYRNTGKDLLIKHCGFVRGRPKKARIFVYLSSENEPCPFLGVGRTEL